MSNPLKALNKEQIACDATEHTKYTNHEYWVSKQQCKYVMEHTKYTNREYWANNIGNVCECSFPFSMAMACSYKEKASSIFSCNINQWKACKQILKLSHNL